MLTVTLTITLRGIQKCNSTHITEKIAKTNKGIGLTKKLHNVLSHRALLIIICKCLIRPNLGYGEFIVGQPKNDSFYSKIESVQHNAALAITGAIYTRNIKLSYTSYTTN